ncbi:hypothetical protein [Tunicatimonas pelagia]|uniref:hypothetical protein n=1 Tax=Tunicatimonas pelagia TaxID=931531 RepID=UPI0026671DBF|nr:hypothetical protein [Tunicatimonas pelagia]WKN40486.1 hypothetical protein P0M28_15690 [Tunicatimonas pelagia]
MKTSYLGYCVLVSALLLTSCQEEKVSEEVQDNTPLLTVQVEEGYLLSDENILEREWLFVSTDDGEVLRTQEVVNGENLTIKRPEGAADESFTISRARVFERLDTQKQFLYLLSYTDVSSQNWVFEGKDITSDNPGAPSVPSLYEVEGSFVSSSLLYAIHAKGNLSVERQATPISDGFQVDFKAFIEEEKAPLYINIFDDQPQYLYTDVEFGKEYSFTPQDFKPMNLVKTIQLPSLASASTAVYGTAIDGTWIIAYQSVLSEGKSEISYYLPEHDFKKLDYIFRANVDERVNYYRSDYNNIPDNYDIPSSVSYQINENKLNNFSASADLASDFWLVSSFSHERNHKVERASIHVNGGNNQNIAFAITLPEEIAQEYPAVADRLDNFSLERINLSNYNNIDSYQEYTATLYDQLSLGNSFYENISINISDSENGRWDTASSTQTNYREDLYGPGGKYDPANW